jgi:hypothetical protein
MGEKIHGIEEPVGNIIDYVSEEGGASGGIKGAAVGATALGLGAAAVAAALAAPIAVPLISVGLAGALWEAIRGSKRNKS